MDKKVFLDALRDRLQGLPKEDLDNRIAFYSEMIDDRIDDGKTEEEAVADIGTVDEIVRQIAEETPLAILVKEKARPRRALRAWEIILIVLGFPLWFPLLLTAFLLCLVAYLLIWVLVFATYAAETAFAFGSVGSLVGFFVYLSEGQFNLASLGSAIMFAGAAMLFVFACIGATKLTIKLSKMIILSIKSAFMKKGAKK